MSYYYAVVCVDAAGNFGAPGATDGSITNEAKSIPTISHNIPSNIDTHADLYDWTDRGITVSFFV